MKSIINASFQAIKSQVTHSVRSVEAEMLCYQAFGFDFMLDEVAHALCTSFACPRARASGFCSSTVKRMWFVAFCRPQELSIWVSERGCQKVQDIDAVPAPEMVYAVICVIFFPL